MPSKLRKALGAVKDQTSISLAKVSINKTSLDVAILKATSHEEVPIDDRYVNEILQTIATNKTYSAACAHTIAKRIGKTKNWVVALKSLMLVLRIFQDGDPYFPREVLHAMKRGAKILNLINFRDDSNSIPWDYTSFVRTFSLYLDERLDCFLTGKLQKKFDFREAKTGGKQKNKHDFYEPVRKMKPAILIDRISNWQKLLDRAMGTRPTEASQTNSLIHLALYAVVQESFDLYRDISEALALLLDSFFQLQYQSCVTAFQTCRKASKQFVGLTEFYELCKSIGIGKTSEYPSVQSISDELIQTLQEFLKDHPSFPGNTPPNQLALAGNTGSRDTGIASDRIESYEHSEVSEMTERYSDYVSQTTSLEDFLSATDTGLSPRPSVEFYLDRSNRNSQQSLSHMSNGESEAGPSLATANNGRSGSSLSLFDDWPEAPPSEPGNNNFAPPADHADQANTILNLFEDWHDVGLENLRLHSPNSSKDGWELALLETAKQPIETPDAPPFLNGLYDQAPVPEPHNNPFLQDIFDVPDNLGCSIDSSSSNALMIFPASDFALASVSHDLATINALTLFPDDDDIFPVVPTFQATTAPPTFRATKNASSGNEISDPFSDNDPFGDPFASGATTSGDQLALVSQENVLQEKKLWLEYQNKIIAKHL